MSDDTPTVSVITATYNRSSALRYTIESLLRSHLEDWEQIVVGDGCTDDTEAVVHSFADPRVRFINLPHNTGDEAMPHNEGFRLARGRYIAYLNHDDLWLPEHLDTAVQGIEATGADLVNTLALSVAHDRPAVVLGSTPNGTYAPVVFVPQSTWLLRRSLLDEIGPWRQHSEVWTEPPQDLLVRAWRARKTLRTIARVTVIKLHARSRPGVYATREHDENRARLEELVSEPDAVLRRLADAGVESAAASVDLRVWRHFRRAAINAAFKVALSLRIPPVELKARFTHRRRGAYFERWRRTVGLPPGHAS